MIPGSRFTTSLPRFVRTAGVVFAMLLIPVAAHEGHDLGNFSTVENSSSVTDDAGEAASSVEDEAKADFLAPGSPSYKAVRYAGKFHLLALHFPISFLLAAMVAQWFVVVRGSGRTVVRVLLWCGTTGAMIAAVLGWMHAYDSVYFGEDARILEWHRWLGTATAAVSVLTLPLRSRLGPKTLAVALTICGLLVGAAGHFGGSLVHGPDYLFTF